MLQKSSAQKVFYAEKSLAINRSSPLGEIRRLENFAIKRRLKQAGSVENQLLPACGVFLEKSFRVPKFVPKILFGIAYRNLLFYWFCFNRFVLLLKFIQQ